MKLSVIAAVACLIALAGCVRAQPLWIKPGASIDEFNQDKYACLQQTQQPSSSAYVGRYGGVAQSGVITNVGLYGACMNSHGWYETPVSDVKAFNDALRPLIDEQRQLCSSADLQVLFAQKMPCKPEQNTVQQLSDRSKISDEQKIALSKWKTVLDESNIKLAAIHRQYNSKNGDAIASAIESLVPNTDKNVSDLTDGRISWGEFNKRRAELGKRYQEDVKLALQRP